MRKFKNLHVPLLMVLIAGVVFAQSKVQDPSILVVRKYLEGWEEPLKWIRSFHGKEVLTLCGSELKIDKVIIKSIAESKLEWREISVETECSGSFILPGTHKLKPNKVKGHIYNHYFGQKGDLKIELDKLKANFVLKKKEGENFDLVLESKGSKRVLAQRSPYSNRYYIRDKLIWAGDLNSDNIIDFLIDFPGFFCPSENQLFLSDKSVKNNYRIFKQVESGVCI